MTIKNYCLQISKLLEGTNNSDKSDTFTSLANHYDFDKNDVISKIKSMYGGMGSFSDMVLYKNGKVDFEGNEKLSIVREELYNAVASEISKMRS
jgi:ribosomal protein S24E